MFSVLEIPRSLLQRLIVPSRRLAQRSQHQCQVSQAKRSNAKWKKMAFNMAGFNKYGVYSDDVLDPSSIIVQEALRRLPEDVLDARNFRLIRAIHLDFLGIQLPREKWITYEQDLEYRYLLPYLKEVAAEIEEIHEFGCLNYGLEYWPHREVK